MKGQLSWTPKQRTGMSPIGVKIIHRAAHKILGVKVRTDNEKLVDPRLDQIDERAIDMGDTEVAIDDHQGGGGVGIGCALARGLSFDPFRLIKLVAQVAQRGGDCADFVATASLCDLARVIASADLANGFFQALERAGNGSCHPGRKDRQ